MSSFKFGKGDNLYDPATGAWVGVVGPGGEEQVVIPPGSKALTAIPSAQGVDKFELARRVGLVAVVHSLVADSIGAASTAVQRLDFAKIPAGSLQVGDVIRVTHARTKSGVADTSSAVLRAGASNTVADGVLGSVASLATTTTAAGAVFEYKVTSATTVRQLGSTNGNLSLAGTSTGAIYADKTIPNIELSDLYIGIYDTMTAGTEYVTLGAFSVEYIPAVA